MNFGRIKIIHKKSTQKVYFVKWFLPSASEGIVEVSCCLSEHEIILIYDKKKSNTV